MNLKSIASVATLLFAGLASGTASATAVSCGDSDLGVRIVTINPGLVGGFCYAQQGNITGDDFSAIKPDGVNSLTFLSKENADGFTDGTGNFRISASPFGGTSGNWNILGDPFDNPWSTYNRVFIGFHFGDGKPGDRDVNPDSFVLELAPVDLSGLWELTGDGAKLTGLSNIYLLGYDKCTGRCGGGGDEIPEPASLALVAVGLLGAGLASRRRQSKKA